MKTIRLLLVALAALATALAVDTHFWQHGERSDFESGTLKNLSLRADGRIFLAPEFTARPNSTSGRAFDGASSRRPVAVSHRHCLPAFSS